MKREVILFGSYGALGTAVSSVFLKKDFDGYHFFDNRTGPSHVAYTDKPVDFFLTGNLSDEENVEKVFSLIQPDRVDANNEQILQKDTLYFLCSTIGGFFGGSDIEDIPFDRYTQMIETNLTTNFLLMKHFTRLIKKSAGGSACFISAYTGSHTRSGSSVYDASKAALSHLVKVFASEGAKYNLSVNAIAPKLIDTPSNREWMTPEISARAQKPEEIGKLIYELFDNFRFISGSVIELGDRLPFSVSN